MLSNIASWQGAKRIRRQASSRERGGSGKFQGLGTVGFRIGSENALALSSLGLHTPLNGQKLQQLVCSYHMRLYLPLVFN